MRLIQEWMLDFVRLFFFFFTTVGIMVFPLDLFIHCVCGGIPCYWTCHSSSGDELQCRVNLSLNMVGVPLKA